MHLDNTAADCGAPASRIQIPAFLRRDALMTTSTQGTNKACTTDAQGMYKGCTRDQHARNPGAIPEQCRSNTLSPGVPHGGNLDVAKPRNRLPGGGGSPIMPGAMPPAANSTSLNAALPASSRPSHTRYWVIVFAVALAIIQYVDRVCISQAAPHISRDLSLNKWQMGWVFSAFTLAYALFEIP